MAQPNQYTNFERLPSLFGGEEVFAVRKDPKEVTDYENFTEKFKAKNTTDECLTPPAIYEAVKNWVFKRYGLSSDTPIIRPFYKGGDYLKEYYPEGCVVLDNPPFSIITKICRHYRDMNIRFFLFAPSLTLFQLYQHNKDVSFVLTRCEVTYENGAKVRTAFATNLKSDIFCESANDLSEAIEAAQLSTKVQRKAKAFPPHTYSSATLLKYSRYQWQIPKDAVRLAKQKVFGGGVEIYKDIEKIEAEVKGQYERERA